jgi:hypothetical protein
MKFEVLHQAVNGQSADFRLHLCRLHLRAATYWSSTTSAQPALQQT